MRNYILLHYKLATSFRCTYDSTKLNDVRMIDKIAMEMEARARVAPVTAMAVAEFSFSSVVLEMVVVVVVAVVAGIPFHRALHRSVKQMQIWSSTKLPLSSLLPQSDNLS